MGRRAEQVSLQRCLESVLDGERYDQRHHASRDTKNGNERDDRNHHLLALGAEVAAGDKKFKHKKEPEARSQEPESSFWFLFRDSVA